MSCISSFFFVYFLMGFPTNLRIESREMKTKWSMIGTQVSSMGPDTSRSEVRVEISPLRQPLPIPEFQLLYATLCFTVLSLYFWKFYVDGTLDIHSFVLTWSVLQSIKLSRNYLFLLAKSLVSYIDSTRVLVSTSFTCQIKYDRHRCR